MIYLLLCSETDGSLIIQMMAIYCIDSLLISFFFLELMKFSVLIMPCAVLFGFVLSR